MHDVEQLERAARERSRHNLPQPLAGEFCLFLPFENPCAGPWLLAGGRCEGEQPEGANARPYDEWKRIMTSTSVAERPWCQDTSRMQGCDIDRPEAPRERITFRLFMSRFSERQRFAARLGRPLGVCAGADPKGRDPLFVGIARIVEPSVHWGLSESAWQFPARSGEHLAADKWSELARATSAAAAGLREFVAAARETEPRRYGHQQFIIDDAVTRPDAKASRPRRPPRVRRHAREQTRRHRRRSRGARRGRG